MVDRSSVVVIGIDPSLTATGVCVVRDGKEALTKSFGTGPGEPMPARLAYIRRVLLDYVVPERPALVAMESETFGQQSQSATAAVQWTYQLALWETVQTGPLRFGPVFRFLSVNPAHVKKWLGAKKKDEVLLQIFKRYGREFKDDNEADAYAIAMIGAAFLPYEMTGSAWPETTKPQREVLEKLRQTGLVWESSRAPAKKSKKAKRAAL